MKEFKKSPFFLWIVNLPAATFQRMVQEAFRNTNSSPENHRARTGIEENPERLLGERWGSSEAVLRRMRKEGSIMYRGRRTLSIGLSEGLRHRPIRLASSSF